MEFNGDQLSTINSFGLLLCLCGIAGHIWHKSTKSQNSESFTNGGSNNSSNNTNSSDFKSTEEEIERILQIDKNKRLLDSGDFSEQTRKGLLRYESDDEEVDDSKGGDSMDESDQLIFDILKRRDYVSSDKT